MTRGGTIPSGQIVVVKQVQGIISVGPSGGLMSDCKMGVCVGGVIILYILTLATRPVL